MQDQPICTVKAHIFKLNLETKKDWISKSKSYLPLSFFYDSKRDIYRIICVDGTKAIVNSTISKSMHFAKTSAKFGQWTDSKTSTVYGIGFSCEADMLEFLQVFEELKSKMDQPGLPDPQVRESEAWQGKIKGDGAEGEPTANGTGTPRSGPEVGVEEYLDMIEQQKLDINILKSNNQKLTAALKESSKNVEEWQVQLKRYKEEATKGKARISELEAQRKEDESTKNRELAQKETQWKAELSKKEDTITRKDEELSLRETELAEVRQKIDDFEAIQFQTNSDIASMKAMKDQNLELRQKIEKVEENLKMSHENEDKLKNHISLLDTEVNAIVNTKNMLNELLKGK